MMMMPVNKRGASAVILILLCLISIFVLKAYGDGEGEVAGQNKEQVHEKVVQNKEQGNEKWTGALSKILGSGVFPFSSISHVPTPGSATAISYWDKLKAMVNQVYPKSLHPNLDFRGSEHSIGSGQGSRAGAGETVKDAVGRSMERSKEAVEDSAKSAAKMATDAVHMTTEGVKKGISAMKDTDTQAEL